MNSAIERLLSLRVRDVMSKSVITVGADATLADAAATLLKHEISGAPVVDELGRCVGVLSGTDFIRREVCLAAADRPPLAGACYALSSTTDEEALRIDSINDEQVSSHMSKAVQSISADATLTEAARAMCAAHLHRLPVLESNGRAIGMISSLDIVSAMAKAIEE